MERESASLEHTCKTIGHTHIVARVLTQQYTNNTFPSALGCASVMIRDGEED